MFIDAIGTEKKKEDILDGVKELRAWMNSIDI